MNEVLISIIVPVYNVEKYIEKCIYSLINQTYKNIEILLIDDGSTDKSGKICDEFQKKDNRIHVFHKENRGLSDTRNYGIKIAKGEYIAFVDSDDYVEDNMYEKLYKKCIENDCEIVFSNKFREDENGNIKKQKDIKESFIGNKEDGLRNILVSDPSVCDKIFKKEIFKNIEFPLNKLYEDILTTPRLVENANKIYFDSSYYYHYIQHQKSIVHGKFTVQKMDYLYNAKKLYEKIKKDYPKLSEEADSYFLLVITTILTDIYCQRKEFKQEYKILKKELKNFKKKYIKNKYISKMKKIMIFLDMYGLIRLTNIIKKIRMKLI